MLGIKVSNRDAEIIKRYIIKNRFFDFRYKAKTEKNSVIFPVNSRFDIAAPKTKFIDAKFELTSSKATLKEALMRKLSIKEQEFLRRGFDTVGDIAILDIPKELEKREQLIAKQLLYLNPQIKTAIKKEGIHTGIFRTQKMRYLAGEKKNEATYKENGVVLKLDVEQVYFSPRLANERKRIAEQIKPHESVIVMFSGCAPYPLVIAKHSDAKEIIGIELNPTAHKYAMQNVHANRINNIRLIQGDVKKIIPISNVGWKSHINDKDIDCILKEKPLLVEFHLNPGDIEHKMSAIKKAILRMRGVEIMIHQPNPEDYKERKIGLASVDKKKQEGAMSCYMQLEALCNEFSDLKGYIIHPDAGDDLTYDINALISNLKKLNSEKYYLENTSNYFSDKKTILNIIRKARVRNFCIDLVHLRKNGFSTARIISFISAIKKICNVYFHIADSKGDHDNLVPGKGDIDFNKIAHFIEKGVAEVYCKDYRHPKEMKETIENPLFKKTFDRIVMPLPKGAHNFIDCAFASCHRGTIIHLYDFLHEKDYPKKAIEKIMAAAKKNNRRIRILNAVKCGEYAPHTYRVCIDFSII